MSLVFLQPPINDCKQRILSREEKLKEIKIALEFHFFSRNVHTSVCVFVCLSVTLSHSV